MKSSECGREDIIQKKNLPYVARAEIVRELYIYIYRLHNDVEDATLNKLVHVLTSL